MAKPRYRRTLREKGGLREKSMEEFLKIIGSPDPAPGGGSACAFSAALSAALLQMAIGVSEREPEGEELRVLYTDMEACCAEGLSLVDEDAAAFDNVIEAHRLPKGNREEKDRRRAAIHEALLKAASVPMRTASICLAELEKALVVVKKCKRSCVSDAAVGVYLAWAGLKGALSNVRVNLDAVKDLQAILPFKIQVNLLEEKANLLFREICQELDKRIP